MGISRIGLFAFPDFKYFSGLDSGKAHIVMGINNVS